MNKIEQLIQELCPDGVEYKSLGKIFKISRGRVLSKDYLRANTGTYPVYSSQTANNGEIGKIKTYDYDGEYLTWTTDGAHAGTIFYRNEKFSITNVCGLLKSKYESINPKFAYYILSIIMKRYVSSGMGNPKLMSNVVEKISIPLPPLPIQQEIVSILNKFAKLGRELEAELEARKKQYEHYQNELFKVSNEGVMSNGIKTEWTTLDIISKNLSSKRRPVKGSDRKSGDYPYYGASGIVEYVSSYIFDGDYLLISEDGANLLTRNTPIAFSISGKAWVNNHAHVLQFDTYATRRFVEIYLNSIDLSKFITGAAQPKLNKENLNKIQIPLPSLPEQERIVTILDKFDTLVNDTSIGIPAEIEARRKQYEYYRAELLNFKNISNG